MRPAFLMGWKPDNRAAGNTIQPDYVRTKCNLSVGSAATFPARARSSAKPYNLAARALNISAMVRFHFEKASIKESSYIETGQPPSMANQSTIKPA